MILLENQLDELITRFLQSNPKELRALTFDIIGGRFSCISEWLWGKSKLSPLLQYFPVVIEGVV